MGSVVAALAHRLSSRGSRALEHRLNSRGSGTLEHRLSSRGSRALECRLSSCVSRALERRLSSRGSRLWSAGSAVVAHGLSCFAVSGIFPDQGWSPHLLHWQADSLPLSHQEGPLSLLFKGRGCLDLCGCDKMVCQSGSCSHVGWSFLTNSL